MGSEASIVALALKECKNSISSACPEIEIESELSENGTCSALMMEFKMKVENCGSDESSCTCYKEAVDMSDEVKACAKKSKEAKDVVKTKLKTCKTAFTACKTHQDSAVGFAATCHKNGKYGMKTTKMPMGTTVGMRRNRILRQIMENNMLPWQYDIKTISEMCPNGVQTPSAWFQNGVRPVSERC